MAPTPHALRERLVVWASDGAQRDAMLRARADYFRETGDIREEEPTYEACMDAFVDWYVCDHVGGDGLTAAARFARVHAGVLAGPDVALAEAFTATRASLFRVHKVVADGLELADLLAGNRVSVSERRHVAGVNRGDVLSARVVEADGHWWMTGVPMFHPAEARSLLARLARHHRKQPGADTPALLRTLMARRVRVDRYRKVPPDHHYKDLAPPRRWLPW